MTMLMRYNVIKMCSNFPTKELPLGKNLTNGISCTKICLKQKEIKTLNIDNHAMAL